MKKELKFRQKLAIKLDKITQIILFIICLPLVLIFWGSNKAFQFLADFNQKCSDILVGVVAHKIYVFISNLLLKIGGQNA